MFEQELKLINDEQFKIINNTRILLVGLGGVGGSVFEMLVRLGFKNIIIIDNDKVSISNLNRQLLYHKKDINKLKVDVALKKAKSINNKLNVQIVNEFLTAENLDKYLCPNIDYVIDACDTITTKIALIKSCLKLNIKFITVMGTGNRIDASQVTIKDFWSITNDPLARMIRKLLRQNGIKDLFMAVCSNEKAIKVNNSTPGSIATVPNIAGILCANYVFNNIIKE